MRCAGVGLLADPGGDGGPLVARPALFARLLGATLRRVLVMVSPRPHSIGRFSAELERLGSLAVWRGALFGWRPILLRGAGPPLAPAGRGRSCGFLGRMAGLGVGLAVRAL